MDYDRALYRVYERIMEELNASPSPLALPSSHPGRTSSSSQFDHRHHNDRAGVDRHANRMVASADVEGSGVDPAPPTNINVESTRTHDLGDGHGGVSVTITTSSVSPTLAARRRFSYSTLAMQQRQRQLQRQPLPFFFPIWMARKIDQVMEHNRLLHHYNISLDYLWTKIRGWIDDLAGSLGGSRHATYSSVTTSAPMLNSSLLSSTPTSVSSSTSFNDHRDVPMINANNLQAVDVEGGQIISSVLRLQQYPSPNDQSPSSSSIGDGLRRRSSSRQEGTLTIGSDGPDQRQRDDTLALPSSSLHRRGGDITVTQGDNIPPPMPNLSQSQRVESSSEMHNGGQYQRSRSSSYVSDNSSVIEGFGSNEENNTSSSSDVSTTSSNDDSITRRDDDDDAFYRHVGGINANDHNPDRGGCSQLNLYIAMRLSFAVAVLHIFILISLHSTYVGPYAFRGWQQNQSRKGDEATNNATFINCISYALSTRPVEDRSSYFDREVKNDPSNGTDIAEQRLSFKTGIDSVQQVVAYLQGSHDETAENSQDVGKINSGKSASEVFHPLLGKDEILQIKIVYGKRGCVGQCSKVRKVQYPDQSNTESSENSTDEGTQGEQSRVLFRDETPNDDQSSLDYYVHAGRRALLYLSITSAMEDNKIWEDELSSPTYWEKVHYRFGLDDALLHLDEMSAFLHNITLVNVTVSERCLSSGSDDGDLSILSSIGEFFSQIYGMDSIIINQLMYGIRGADGAFLSGYLKSMETQERWGWHSELLDAFENESIKQIAVKKLGVLSMSMLAFFLVTSVTSLIVRVLTSSGVVLMFPMFTLLRSLGLRGADERLISLSYPWIGAARAAISAERSHPQGHLVYAHVTKVLLYYVMYEACQAAWSVVLYAKSIPEALPVWIFGFAMVFEYFSMVFVRSALSVQFFPRVTLLYFLCYHVYFYSVPYGYFGVALIPLIFFMIHAMLFTIIGLEVPKSARGVLSVACPREVFNRLSWQAPSAAIPQEWTIFLPLNSRLNPLHDREISSGQATSTNV